MPTPVIARRLFADGVLGPPGSPPGLQFAPVHGGFGPQLVVQSGGTTRVTFGPTVAAATLSVVSPPDSTLTRTAVSVKYEPGWVIARPLGPTTNRSCTFTSTDRMSSSAMPRPSR